MTVKSRKEAWKKVDEIFPTDYEKDEQSSINAGYPIYRSTVDGVNAWISDLNVTLELNFPDRETIRINIQSVPKIVEERKWYTDNVRMVCCDHHWYDRGTVEQYSEMLDFVRDNEPTGLNIFKVADDIILHTVENWNIETVMFYLMKDACFTYFKVKTTTPEKEQGQSTNLDLTGINECLLKDLEERISQTADSKTDKC